MAETERIIETVIPPEQEGQRLDHWLSKRFDYLSRTQWQKNIRQGAILLNQRRTRSARILHAGDMVTYKAVYTEPAVDMSYDVIYDDDSLLVVSKSGNLPCHPAGPFFQEYFVVRP